jgi:glycosyltransferase involved in cell wall biosynthesis
MQKSILFITTNSFATNPRLTKEVRTCIALGHRVSVISFQFSNWSEELNNQLIYEFANKANLITLAGDRRSKKAWLASTIMQGMAKLFLPLFSENIYLSSTTIFKRSSLLLLALQRQSKSFDLVIAHNPGAFVPAYLYAKAKRIRLGIDIEDFHPGEENDVAKEKGIARLMKFIISRADIVTAASPLILDYSTGKEVYKNKSKGVLNNVFPLSQQPTFKTIPIKPLKLIWFSQTVGLNRGIQDVVQAMNLIEKTKVILTLVGYCSEEVRVKILSISSQPLHTIRFVAPVDEQSLFEVCSNHHIGLALEIGKPLNRDLCLTNKLFAYLLAGNAIIATETSAQKKFFDENSGIGQTFPIGDSRALAELIVQYAILPDTLENDRKCAYQLSKTKLNWEAESALFTSLYELN